MTIEEIRQTLIDLTVFANSEQNDAWTQEVIEAVIEFVIEGKMALVFKQGEVYFINSDEVFKS